MEILLAVEPETQQTVVVIAILELNSRARENRFLISLRERSPRKWLARPRGHHFGLIIVLC